MEPWFDEAEAKSLHAYALSGGWGTEFRVTAEFEQLLAEFSGARHCVVTNSGTVALVLALLALEVGPGDEVVVPDLTMIATPNAAKLLGATPVFVDIEPATLNIDLEQVAAALTPRTKAVVHVSLNGRSNDLEALKALCREHGVALLEDAAQSLGSYHGARHLGTIGDVGCFSFSTQKIITTGQGGAVVTDDDALAHSLRRLKDFGRAQGGTDIHVTIGYNFRFTDYQAVVGVEQMKKLRPRLARKKEIWRRYREALEGLEAVTWIDTDLTQVTPWFIDVYVEQRDRLIADLKARGIGARPIYPPIHSQQAYGLADRSFPVTELYASRGVWLPSASQLTDDQIATVCAAIRAIYEA